MSHDDHDLSAPDGWTAPEGSAGYVRAGPQSADGYTWWQVAFNSGVTGLCVQRYLDGAPVDGHGVGHGDGSGRGDGGDSTEPAFADGDVVHATTTLNTRKQPGTGEELVDTSPVARPPRSSTAPWTPTATRGGVSTGRTRTSVAGASSSTSRPAPGDGGGDGNEPSTDFDVQTDLTVPVDVTGDEIDAAIAAERPDSPLIGLGDTFVATQERYGVNAVYQAAHAIHESAWGTSTIAQDKQNLFGWGAEDSDPSDGAKYFETFEDCVDYVIGEIADLYLEPGNWRYNGPTLDGMNVYYATDDQWAEKIAAHYRTLAGNI